MYNQQMNMRHGPDLHFFPATVPEGFATTDVSHNRSPYAAIRELIQNSLDAGINASGNAIIQFSVENIRMEDIPAISELRRAFDSACGWMKKTGRLAGSNAQIVKKIKEEIEKDETTVLFVSDNGIGLNRHTMPDLLGNGASAKGENEAGAFGVGHFAAFALSRLNYLLYGGKSAKETIAAGHAQLASHFGKDGNPRGKNGYYVMGFCENNLDAPFNFPQHENVPSFLNERLNSLPGDSESGSVVAIIGFNYLTREEEELVDHIETVSVDNFFPAIRDGRLVVEVITKDGKKTSVDKQNLDSIVERGREKKRWWGIGSNYPSTQRAIESFETLKNGTSLKMSLNREGENIAIYLRENVDRPHVAICRKGMWITDSFHPICHHSHYSDKIQFDALLLIEPNAGETHNIIKDAETPLHNELSPKTQMEGDEEGQQKIRTFSKAVREYLKEQVQDLDTNPYAIPEFINVEIGESVGESLRGAYYGKGIGVSSRSRDGDTPPPPDPDELVKSLTNFLKIRSSQSPATKKARLLVEADQEWEDVELRVGVDGGSDDSCSGLPWEDLTLRNVTMDGRELLLLGRSDTEGGSSKKVRAKVGNLQEKTLMQFEIEFESSEALEQLVLLFDFYQRIPAGNN